MPCDLEMDVINSRQFKFERSSMSNQTIMVTLPDAAFHRLQRTAELTYRSVDDLIASALNVSLSVPSDMPAEIAAELDAMARFSDAALWAASESSMSLAQQRRLHQLNHAAGARVLTAAEQIEQAQLLELYQRAVLRRARALALLDYRGHSLPDRADLPDVDETDDNGDDT